MIELRRDTHGNERAYCPELGLSFAKVNGKVVLDLTFEGYSEDRDRWLAFTVEERQDTVRQVEEALSGRPDTDTNLRSFSFMQHFPEH